MSFLQKSIGPIAMGLVLGCVSWAMADEAGDLAKTPKAVQDSIKKVIGSNELGDIEKEIEEGKPIYEAEYKVKGVTYVVVVAEDGKLIEHGVEVEQSFVPEAAMATVKKTQPTAKIAEVAMMVGNNRMYFTIEVKVGQDIRILRINAGGRLISDTSVKEAPASAEPAKTEADENTAALAKAPKAVQDTVKKTIGTNSLEGFDKEIENGKTTYEVNYKVGGTDYAIIVGVDGKINEREIEVDMSFVPPHILAAAKKAQPKGTVAEVTVLFADNKLLFEVESKVGNDMHEIQISPDGKVIADTVAKPEAASTEAGEEPEKEETKTK